jgi:formylglycine-generating enzyme required for sulfatase activity
MSISRMFAPAALAFTLAAAAHATVPETVPVGNPGNKADSTGFGAVSYEYKIGKYEVTNAEYCEFLNAVAKTDSHDLYDGRMNGGPENWGGIARNGNSGSFTYAIRDGMSKKPVSYVRIESAFRYTNWLTNGQGSGDTEKGVYDLASPVSPDHAALAVGKTAMWVVSSENEWYKAAYYDPNKQGGGYWHYPSKSNDVPQANLNTNVPSDAGSFANFVSAYGTFDQGGNVWEYNDTKTGNKWGLRGGSFYINDNENYMRSTTRYDVLSAKWPNYGFRVVRLGGGK